MAGRHLVGSSREMMLPEVPTPSWGTQHLVAGHPGASQQDGDRQAGTEAGAEGPGKGQGLGPCWRNEGGKEAERPE